MVKLQYIVIFAACCLCGCGVQIPMDDAYHLRSQAKKTETPPTQSVQSTPIAAKTEPKATMEFINVQDTTVTVVIKRK